MRVYVNGEEKEVSDKLSLGELIVQLDLPVTRVAIELNRTVVRRANWETTILAAEDRLEIVHFVGGGASELFNNESAVLASTFTTRNF